MSKFILFSKEKCMVINLRDVSASQTLGRPLTEPSGDSGECLRLARLHGVEARRFYHINKTNINHTPHVLISQLATSEIRLY
jgi:hypothetical protein